MASESVEPTAEEPAIEEPTVERLDRDGLALSHLVAGPTDGQPIVLLHGGGIDRARFSWKQTLPALAEEYRVYAPDWPGYGDSDPPERTPSIEYYMEVLDRYLDHVLEETGQERVTLLGISMGGGVGLGYATLRPERLESLVLVDSYGLGGAIPGGSLGSLFVTLPLVNDLVWGFLRRSRWATARSLRAVADSRNVSGGLIAEAHELIQAATPDAWQAFQRNEVGPRGLRTNYLDDLPNLDVPTLLVHGERDPLIPVAWAVRAHALLPNSELRVLANCGHMPPRERPWTFNRVLMDCLRAK